MGSGAATILHADLDAFYASVEQLLDPRLRGLPVAVGGSVVLAASYEARAFGVRSGMAAWRARQLCPGLRFVGGHFEEYRRLGDEVMGVFRDFTPMVERVSIDEAFLDVAGARRLFGSPRDIALAIRRRAREEIGLAISVGAARTKHLAKVASQVAKPDGLTVVEPDGEREFLDPLPVGLVWGVGAATGARLASVGIRTIGDLHRASSSLLEGLLGTAAGATLSSLVANVDPRPVETLRGPVSVGAQAALGSRPATPELVRATIGYLADRVATRLRSAGRAGRTVTVRVRFGDLAAVTRSVTLPSGICATLTLTDVATELAMAAIAADPRGHRVSLLAVTVSKLVDDESLQLELPLATGDDRYRPGTAANAARSSVDRSVDAVRARFGRDSLDYAVVVFSDVTGVPDAFRELAERQ